MMSWKEMSLKDKVLGLVILAIIFYLAWSIWGSRPPAPSKEFVQAAPAVSTQKVEGPKVQVPIRVVPKKAVKDKFPTARIEDPAEEVIDTATVPPAPNGATTITTIDTRTGEAKTQIQIAPAPWFALERSNEVGVTYGVKSAGEQFVAVHYRRDLARIKDVHLTGQVEGLVPIIPGPRPEFRAGIQVNYRF